MPGKGKKSTQQKVEAPISQPQPHQPQTGTKKIRSSQLKGKPAEMSVAPSIDPTTANYASKLPKEPEFSSPAVDLDVDEANLEGAYDMTKPPSAIETKDKDAMIAALQLESQKAQITEQSLVHHQYTQAEWIEAGQGSLNKLYEICPQILATKDNTVPKMGPKQGYVTGQMGDYDSHVSAEALFLGGQLATQANRIKRALLYNEDIDQPTKEISFKKWQKIVNARAREGLKLQIEKTQRDEIVMQLQQKNLMLNRNEIFEDQYFKKPVFLAKHQKTM